MGKASLVLDMVDVQEQDSGLRWNKFLSFLTDNFFLALRRMLFVHF